MKAKTKYVIQGFAVVMAFFVLSCSKPSYLPDELVGVWITSNPRYADRYFELSKVSAIFGTGDATVDTYFISNVKNDLKDEGNLYTIYCHREGANEEKISLYYTSENNGMLWFKNQKHVEWVKAF